MNRKDVLTASPKKALSENVRERPVADLGMRLSRRKTMQNRENGPGGTERKTTVRIQEGVRQAKRRQAK